MAAVDGAQVAQGQALADMVVEGHSPVIESQLVGDRITVLPEGDAHFFQMALGLQGTVQIVVHGQDHLMGRGASWSWSSPSPQWSCFSV